MERASGSIGRTLPSGSRFSCSASSSVLIADALSPHVGAVFDAAAKGDPVTAIAAWGAAFAFSAQIYFDFSGYSDMAIGLAVVQFPPAREFRRTAARNQHLGLLAALAHHPFAVAAGLSLRAADLRPSDGVVARHCGDDHDDFGRALARSRVDIRGMGRISRLPSHHQHDLAADHARAGGADTTGQLVGWALTFTAFVVGAVFFRAADIETSWRLLAAMGGRGQPPIAEAITLQHDWWAINQGWISEDLIRTWLGSTWSATGTALTLLALAIALLVPDSMDITGYREADAQSNWRRSVGPLAWRPSLHRRVHRLPPFRRGVLPARAGSEFLYYQF